MVKIAPALAPLVDARLADDVPCLVSTASKEGRPNISVKGSVLVLDEKTLAFRERSHRNAVANIGNNPRVVVWYRNAARSAELPRCAAVRFHGTATIHASGAIRDRVWDRTVPIKRERDPEKNGVAITVALDRVEDLNGTPLP